MARTPEGAALTQSHRLIQVRLTAATIRDLLQLWRTVDPTDLRGTVDAFARAGAILVRTRRQSSAAASQRYYLAFRQVEGVQGALALALAPPVDADVAAGVIRGAGLAGIQRARQRGATIAQAHENGFVKLAGSAASFVAGGGRETLIGAVHSDRSALGWQRVTDSNPCAFCRMIASRGPAFKSEGTADFQAHGHCGCTVEPHFEGSRPIPANERFRAEWDEATQGLSGADALNAFRRHVEGSDNPA